MTRWGDEPGTADVDYGIPEDAPLTLPANATKETIMRGHNDYLDPEAHGAWEHHRGRCRCLPRLPRHRRGRRRQ